MSRSSKAIKRVLAVAALVAAAVLAISLVEHAQTKAQETGSTPSTSSARAGSADATRPTAAQPAGSRPSRSAASAAPGSAAPGRKTLNLLFSGDFLIHSPVFQQALANGGGRRYSFSPMFRYIAPIVRSADLAVCHVEVPMTNRRPAGYPLFNSPPALAGAIRASGWDACDTASNHTLDQGQFGIDQTTRALDRAGIRHTGSYRSASAARTPVIVDVSGVKIALLAYTEMTNGIPLPHPWSVGIARARTILADAARARRAGANAVIVNIHGGNEYQHSPSSFQLALARRLTASRDVTAVVGQHVHVVQPVRWVNGKPVVFGEGNLLSNQTPSCCPAASQDGLMANLRLQVDGKATHVDLVTYRPTWVRHPDFAVLPVSLALKRGLANSGSLKASWSRTTAVLGRSKRVVPG